MSALREETVRFVDAGVPDEEIVATLEWAAGALPRTALHDSERPE